MPRSSGSGTYICAANNKPDDGVFLQYSYSGYVHPRTELTILDASAPTNPFVAGGAEYKSVQVYNGDLSLRESYNESTVNVGITGNVFGFEWSDRGGLSPYVGGQLSLGVVDAGWQSTISLPSGQTMIDLGRTSVGLEYQAPYNKFFITSRGYLESVGGTEGFGTRYAEGAFLVEQSSMTGYWSKGKWISGLTRLGWWKNFHDYDFIRVVPDGY